MGRKTALDDLKLVSGNLNAETSVHPTPTAPASPRLAFLSFHMGGASMCKALPREQFPSVR